MTNIRIRDYAKRNGVCLWQIAKAMSVSEATITRLFREELNDSDSNRIIDIIDKIVKKE